MRSNAAGKKERKQVLETAAGGLRRSYQFGLIQLTVARQRFKANKADTPRIGMKNLENNPVEGHHCFAAILRQLATAKVVVRCRRLTPPAGFSWELGKGCSPLQILSQTRATSPLSNSFSL
jgi:hypothetical protein